VPANSQHVQRLTHRDGVRGCISGNEWDCNFHGMVGISVSARMPLRQVEGGSCQGYSYLIHCAFPIWEGGSFLLMTGAILTAMAPSLPR
jgi:hypothetical protein